MTINSDLVVTVQTSVDGKQYKLSSLKHVPYASAPEYLSLIPSTRRHVGQIGYIANGAAIETWQFIGGILDVNFVLVFSSASSSPANNMEVIALTGVSTFTITWTPTRASLFGLFPHVQVWISDGGVIALFPTEPTIDAAPPSFTTMSFDFGGIVNGFIIIK